MSDSEKRYRSIVESQSELICRFLPDGEITFVNKAFCGHFLRQASQLLGTNFYSLLPKEILPQLKKDIAILEPQQTQAIIEHSETDPNGETSWQQWSITGIWNGTEKVAELQAVGHNITDQKSAELAANRHVLELGALHKATAALLKTLDLEPLLGQILDAAIIAIPAAKRGMLHLIARDTGQLEMRATFGYSESDPRIKKFTLPSGKGYILKAVSERRPLLIHDFQAESFADDETYAASAGNNVKSAIVAPLILNDKVVGALSLESSSRAAFIEADLRLVQSFAATATAAIHNAQLHAEVQKQAITDALTGLYNRRGFFEFGRREIERAFRFDRPLAAIMLDIDDFKSVNDTFGHTAGDQILQIVAERLSFNIRKIDILGRYGGDEFVILLPEIDMFAAAAVAERLRTAVANERFKIDQIEKLLTISLGVAKLTPNINDLETLLHRADDAMYIAKNAGRNRVEIG